MDKREEELVRTPLRPKPLSSWLWRSSSDGGVGVRGGTGNDRLLEDAIFVGVYIEDA